MYIITVISSIYVYTFSLVLDLCIFVIMPVHTSLLKLLYIYYAPGDDSPHGGILLLLCPYVRTYVCPSLVKVFG